MNFSRGTFPDRDNRRHADLTGFVDWLPASHIGKHRPGRLCRRRNEGMKAFPRYALSAHLSDGCQYQFQARRRWPLISSAAM